MSLEKCSKFLYRLYKNCPQQFLGRKLIQPSASREQTLSQKILISPIQELPPAILGAKVNTAIGI